MNEVQADNDMNNICEGQLRDGKIIIISHLTSQRTEPKWVQEASPAHLTSVSYSFPRFWLRPYIQEQNPGTVDHICLHSTYVQHFINFCHPHYIVIRRSSYLINNIDHHKLNTKIIIIIITIICIEFELLFSVSTLKHYKISPIFQTQ